MRKYYKAILKDRKSEETIGFFVSATSQEEAKGEVILLVANLFSQVTCGEEREGAKIKIDRNEITLITKTGEAEKAEIISIKEFEFNANHMELDLSIF